MKSYWYVTRSKKKPKNRGLVSVVLRQSYTLIEFAIEADCSMEEAFGLCYVGYGRINEQSLQISLLRAIKQLR